jgi:hypothetical protein
MKDGGNSMTKPAGRSPVEEQPNLMVHNRLGTVVNNERAADLFDRILRAVEGEIADRERAKEESANGCSGS